MNRSQFRRRTTFFQRALSQKDVFKAWGIGIIVIFQVGSILGPRGKYSLMTAKILSLLLRSQSLPPDQLQEICYRLIRTIQVYFANRISGRLHILPATRRLEWAEYPAETVKASVVTAGYFGANRLRTPFPETPNPTILVECHLQSLQFGPLFNDLFSVVALLKQKLTGILKICGLEVKETHLTWLPVIRG